MTLIITKDLSEAPLHWRRIAIYKGFAAVDTVSRLKGILCCVKYGCPTNVKTIFLERGLRSHARQIPARTPGFTKCLERYHIGETLVC